MSDESVDPMGEPVGEVTAPSLRQRPCSSCGEAKPARGFVGDQCADCVQAQPGAEGDRSTQSQCSACGAWKFRFEFVKGRTICASCQKQVDAWEAVEYAPPNAVPDPEDSMIIGTAADEAWLRDVCGQDGTVTLAAVRRVLTEAMEDESRAIARALDQTNRQLEPHRVPLEIAAQRLYLACYPEIRERFDAAKEMTGYPLWKVIIGNWAYHKDDLAGSDPTFVPELSPHEQFGNSGPRLVPHAPVMQQTDASGNLLCTCQCCGDTFAPPKGRPNPAYCRISTASTESECGNFASALQTWAINKVRTPNMASDPLPEPARFLRPERCTSTVIEKMRQFRNWKLPELEDLAIQQNNQMRGTA